MGKAVVSTTVGAEGLPVTDGRDIVMADAADAFATAVVALLRDPQRRRHLEDAARELVVTRYDWAAVADQFETALTTIPQGKWGRWSFEEDTRRPRGPLPASVPFK